MLYGAIFRCTQRTHNQCIESGIFGAPSDYFKVYQEVGPGTFIYLLNTEQKKLFGVWQAKGSVKEHDGEIFGGRFPCQVQVERVILGRALDYEDLLNQSILPVKQFSLETDLLLGACEVRCLNQSYTDSLLEQFEHKNYKHQNYKHYKQLWNSHQENYHNDGGGSSHHKKRRVFYQHDQRHAENEQKQYSFQKKVPKKYQEDFNFEIVQESEEHCAASSWADNPHVNGQKKKKLQSAVFRIGKMQKPGKLQEEQGGRPARYREDNYEYGGDV